MDFTEGQAESVGFDVFALTLVTSITVHFKKLHQKQIKYCNQNSIGILN